MMTRFTFFFIFSLALFTLNCFAEEQTIITSNTLEYSEETSTYTAQGSVKVQKNDTVLESNELTYNEKTSYVTAVGDVRYDDSNISIRASRAELDFETKTGVLYDAEIFYKEQNCYISGEKIEKKSEIHYLSPEATFTTCDAPVPEWRFRGKDVAVEVGERLTARDVFFSIKNTSVFYTPYFVAPILTERQTGLLRPSLGYSDSKGGHLNLPFFWAISENRDATIILDMYTKRGIGEGLEYRYIYPWNIKGNWWLYHIRDTKLDKDFFEMRGLHEQRSTEGIGGFLSINYVNEKDFYREFNPYIEVRTIRFLESSGELSFPLKDSRLYLLSQYWVDLGDEIRPAPQKLPEAGYILNPTKVGPLWISALSTVSNFWRDEGIIGQRLDIFPRILHTFGSDIVVSQALGFRETAYSLHRSEDKSLHREALEYSIVANTRLLKRYDSFMHVVEPSIGYTLITDSEDPPLFDSTELFKKTSTIELSLLNRFLNGGGEFAVLRASQGYDFNLGDRPFLPFRLEVGIKNPIALRLDASYNSYDGKVDSINSDMRVKVAETTFTLGQRYNRKEEITVYKAGVELQPSKLWYLRGRIWYDAEEKEVRDITLDVKYMSQCWGLIMVFNKKPGDFSVSIRIDLIGLTRGFKI